nr:MAG TPA: Chondroitin N-acetylgalactosaminyltransferase [Bacteriophage sp.]
MLERGPGVNIGRCIVSTMGLPMGCVLWIICG